MSLVVSPRYESLPALGELRAEGLGDGIILEKDFPSETLGQPLEVAILNLMPVKEQTERQLLRRLLVSKLPVRFTFLVTETYHPTHVSKEHLDRFYRYFSEIKDQKIDGLMITGAPVEMMDFEETDYWQELTEIFDWGDTNVGSVLYICWGAQAGLYYHYGIPKHFLPSKQFGIFEHVVEQQVPMTENMASPFLAPHSRNTCTYREDVEKVKNLTIAAESSEAGVYLITDEPRHRVFCLGHSEYEADTLSKEYFRDLAKGLPIHLPVRYFPEDNPANEPEALWQSHSETLYHNFLTQCLKTGKGESI